MDDAVGKDVIYQNYRMLLIHQIVKSRRDRPKNSTASEEVVDLGKAIWNVSDEKSM
jgi:hypothetical protein